MFIVSNRNIMLRSEDGDKVFPLSRGFMGEIPDWAAKTKYFKALCDCGKIVVPKSKADRDIETAAEAAKMRKMVKKSKETEAE